MGNIRIFKGDDTMIGRGEENMVAYLLKSGCVEGQYSNGELNIQDLFPKLSYA